MLLQDISYRKNVTPQLTIFTQNAFLRWCFNINGYGNIDKKYKYQEDIKWN